MRLNHVAITVNDVLAAHGFLEKHFGLKSIGKANPAMAHLQDDAGSILSLFKGPPITEPQTTHIGFMQETEQAVDEIRARLLADGIDAPAPKHSHGYTFWFVAPGGFAVEVVC